MLGPAFVLFLVFSILLANLINKFLKGKTKKNLVKQNQNDDSSEIAKAGGLIEFVRQRHAECGEIIEFYMGKGNHIVSINDPNLIKPTLKCGSRPKALFEFVTPLIGEDNLQIFSAERAIQFRKLVSGCIGPQSNNFQFEIKRRMYNNFLFSKLLIRNMMLFQILQMKY
jgi:hypothetical protein